MVLNFILALTSFLKWNIMHKPETHNKTGQQNTHPLIPLYLHHAETSEELALNPKCFSECGLKALSNQIYSLTLRHPHRWAEIPFCEGKMEMQGPMLKT